MKTLVELTEIQAERLSAFAESRGLTLDEVVAEAVDKYMRQYGLYSRAELMKRARRIFGKYSSELTDISANHDEYFVEAITARDE